MVRKWMCIAPRQFSHIQHTWMESTEWTSWGHHILFQRAAKWWKYLFRFVIYMSIINGFIMMKESANHQVTSKTLRKKDRCQLHFRQNLVKQLIVNYRHKRKRESIQNKASEGLLHWPVILGKKRMCKQCSVRGVRREPTSGCEQCNINLCVDCFKPYHKAKFPALFK